MGRDLMAAVRQGKKTEHGPIPKLVGNGRRRLDRHDERRLTALKRWRGEKATALAIDPGVLCPNSALEAIACGNPKTKAEIQSMPGLKRWFAREFGGEIVKINREIQGPQSES
jgi:ribonuclease D